MNILPSSHIPNTIIRVSVGMGGLILPGVLFLLGKHYYDRFKTESIDSKVQECFDEKTRTQFVDEVRDAWQHSNLSTYQSNVSVQKRWELDGRWQKALEERC